MVSYGYFFQGDNPNIASRIGLVISIADRHELNLGPFASPRIDEAFINGKWYSDKAPGLALMAAPIAIAAVSVLPHLPGDSRWFSQDGQFSFYYNAMIYLCTLSVVAMISSMTLVVMYFWCLGNGATRSAALVATIGLGLCSPFWGWSTVFVGHATCGALLFLGFAGLSGAARRVARGPGVPPVWLGVLSGALLGWGFVTEFTCGPAVAIVGIACFTGAMCEGNRLVSFRRVFLPSAIGLLVATVPLLIYNHAAFGSAFKLGYDGVTEAYPGMEEGFFGITMPKPAIVWELLFGRSRGLLTVWPGFVLLIPAVCVALLTERFRMVACVGALVFVYYLSFNAGYFYWDGGGSTGPRHLIATLPLLAPCIAPLWDWKPSLSRPVIVSIMAAGFVVNLITVSIDMFAPMLKNVADPWPNFFWPRLVQGDLHRSVLAHFLHVNGYLSLVPLLAFIAAVVWSLLRLDRRVRPSRA